MPTGLKFAHKILILGITLILLSGTGITAVTAYQFRTRLYEREFNGAFTVYLAAVNYLSAHYKSKGERFVPQSLDYVFRHKFMRLDGAEEQSAAHTTDGLALYDLQGAKIYAFTPGASNAVPAVIPPAALPATYEQSYDKRLRSLLVSGPLSIDGETLGYVFMRFPSNIEAETGALYRQSFRVMLVICVAAILLSFLFSRRVLRPIEALTRAARRVHEGDLDQQVPISTRDEIGLLGETFNEMISSLVQRIALMHRMQEWTIRISKQFEPDRLFDNLTEMFERMTQASFSRLYVADPPGSPLVLQRECGEPGGTNRTGMAQQAHESGRTQYRAADGAVTDQPCTATEIAVPLSIGTKRLGSIHLGPRAGGESYGDETATMVETLAQHSAMAIENLLLYRAVSERERVQQEMKWARGIQQSLLPHIMPEISGYEIFGVSVPALEVGGDYFDVVPSSTGWNFIIGDVSGKGVPAALIMSIVRSLIHSYAEVADSAEDIIRRVNRKLTPDIESEMFVTLASFSVDPATHAARVVRAGHEPLFIARAGGELERLQPGGTAMGLTDVPLFEEMLEPVACRLDPGDVLVMFTDGITETQNRARQELGYDGLAEMVRACAGRPAHEMVEHIVKAVQVFADGAAPVDDITLLVVRRT